MRHVSFLIKKLLNMIKLNAKKVLIVSPMRFVSLCGGAKFVTVLITHVTKLKMIMKIIKANFGCVIFFPWTFLLKLEKIVLLLMCIFHPQIMKWMHLYLFSPLSNNNSVHDFFVLFLWNTKECIHFHLFVLLFTIWNTFIISYLSLDPTEYILINMYLLIKTSCIISSAALRSRFINHLTRAVSAYTMQSCTPWILSYWDSAYFLNHKKTIKTVRDNWDWHIEFLKPDNY